MDKNKDGGTEAMMKHMMGQVPAGYMQEQIEKNLEGIPKEELHTRDNDGYHTIEGIIMPDGSFAEAVGGHMQTASAIVKVDLVNISQQVYGPSFFCGMYGMVFTQGRDRISSPKNISPQQLETLKALQEQNFMGEYYNMYNQEHYDILSETLEKVYGDNEKIMKRIVKARESGWL